MRSYVTPWTTGGAVPVAVVREPKLTAGGADRYSMVVIDCSSLRSRLRRAGEAGPRPGGGPPHGRAPQGPGPPRVRRWGGPRGGRGRGGGGGGGPAGGWGAQ